MTSVLISVLTTVRGVVRTRAALHLEILALRHQLQGVIRKNSIRNGFRPICVRSDDPCAVGEQRLPVVIPAPLSVRSLLDGPVSLSF